MSETSVVPVEQPGPSQIKPIPPNRLGKFAGAPEEQPVPTTSDPAGSGGAERESAAEPGESFEFAGKTYKSREHAERAIQETRQRFGRQGEVLAEARRQMEELARQNAELQGKLRTPREEEPEPPKKASPKGKAEKDFLASLTDDEIAELKADLEKHGELTVFGKLLRKYDVHKRDEIEALRSALEDVREQTIEEPRRAAEDHKRHADGFMAISGRAREVLNPEGELAYADIYTGDPEEEARNLSTIHEELLLSNWEPGDIDGWNRAVLKFRGLKWMEEKGYLPRTLTKKSDKAPEEPREDLTLSGATGPQTSPLKRRQQPVDQIAGANPHLPYGRLGRLAR